MSPLRPIDLLIAGAQKAGTTSLTDYLAQHPAICAHERSEISFFIDDEEHGRGWGASFDRFYGHCRPDAVLLAKSVAVLGSSALMARVYAHNPAIRIIVVLRNPVDRAVSAYRYAVRKGLETIDTFDEAVEAPLSRHGGDTVRVRNTSYLAQGAYLSHVRRLYELFGRDQVLIHLYEDLASDPIGVCARTFVFAGVESGFLPEVGRRRNTSAAPRSRRLARVLSSQHPLKRAVREALPSRFAIALRRTLDRLNRGSAPEAISPETRARLAAYYARQNEQLGVLIGRDLSSWSAPASPQPPDDRSAGATLPRAASREGADDPSA